MSRSNLTAANRTEATAASLRMVAMLDIAFPSGTLYATSGDHALTFNGNTYSPTGVMVGDPQGLAETVDLSARRISVQMSGLDSSLITKLMGDAYNYATANLYVGFLNERGALVGDPYVVGNALRLSQCTVSLNQGTGAVEVSAETLEVLDARSSAQLATPESQHLRYPGDVGMDDVRAIMEMEVIWGGVYIRGGIRIDYTELPRDTHSNQ